MVSDYLWWLGITCDVHYHCCTLLLIYMELIDDLRQVGVFSNIKKIYRHDITEILSKVVLNTITLALYLHTETVILKV
jgi:hypothetical protein